MYLLMVFLNKPNREKQREGGSERQKMELQEHGDSIAVFIRQTTMRARDGTVSVHRLQ